MLHNWSGTIFKFFRVSEVEEIDVFVQLHCGVLPLLVRQVAWQQGSHLSKEHRRGVRRGGGRGGAGRTAMFAFTVTK